MRRAMYLGVALTAFLAGALAQAAKVKPEPKEVKAGLLSPTDQDGYILFTYSLADGERVAAGDKLPTVKTEMKKEGLTFIFEKHVLSCGTVMTGWITKTPMGKATRYRGNFSVSNNSYKIDTLTGDYSTDGAVKDGQGYLIVNDRKIDIRLF